MGMVGRIVLGSRTVSFKSPFSKWPIKVSAAFPVNASSFPPIKKVETDHHKSPIDKQLFKPTYVFSTVTLRMGRAGFFIQDARLFSRFISACSLFIVFFIRTKVLRQQSELSFSTDKSIIFFKSSFSLCRVFEKCDVRFVE